MCGHACVFGLWGLYGIVFFFTLIRTSSYRHLNWNTITNPTLWKSNVLLLKSFEHSVSLLKVFLWFESSEISAFQVKQAQVSNQTSDFKA